MPIDFEKADPLYLQIADDVRHKISNGDLKVGDQLGSHKELAKFYDVSLITIKKAISNLIDDGFLYSRIGIGTYVARKNSQLNLAKHKSIGIVIRDLNYPFFPLLLRLWKNMPTHLGIRYYLVIQAE
jgi:DNA-binding GntR family transcriptional regulator